MQVTKTVKIGITAQSDENLFGNGLKQNVWFLYRLLKNEGYDIHLVSESDKHHSKNLLGVPISKLDSESISEFKIIIQCATFEFLYKPNLSRKIIIIEYLDVSNFFLHNSQTKYLNAILDKLAKKISK